MYTYEFDFNGEFDNLNRRFLSSQQVMDAIKLKKHEVVKIYCGYRKDANKKDRELVIHFNDIRSFDNHVYYAVDVNKDTTDKELIELTIEQLYLAISKERAKFESFDEAELSQVKDNLEKLKVSIVKSWQDEKKKEELEHPKQKRLNTNGLAYLYKVQNDDAPRSSKKFDFKEDSEELENKIKHIMNYLTKYVFDSDVEYDLQIDSSSAGMDISLKSLERYGKYSWVADIKLTEGMRHSEVVSVLSRDLYNYVLFMVANSIAFSDDEELKKKWVKTVCNDSLAWKHYIYLTSDSKRPTNFPGLFNNLSELEEIKDGKYKEHLYIGPNLNRTMPHLRESVKTNALHNNRVHIKELHLGINRSKPNVNPILEGVTYTNSKQPAGFYRNVIRQMLRKWSPQRLTFTYPQSTNGWIEAPGIEPDNKERIFADTFNQANMNWDKDNIRLKVERLERIKRENNQELKEKLNCYIEDEKKFIEKYGIEGFKAKYYEILSDDSDFEDIEEAIGYCANYNLARSIEAQKVKGKHPIWGCAEL